MIVQPIRPALAEVDARWLALGVFEDEAEPPGPSGGRRWATWSAGCSRPKDISGGARRRDAAPRGRRARGRVGARLRAGPAASVRRRARRSRPGWRRRQAARRQGRGSGRRRPARRGRSGRGDRLGPDRGADRRDARARPAQDRAGAPPVRGAPDRRRPDDRAEPDAAGARRSGGARSSARRSTWPATWSTRPPPRRPPTRLAEQAAEVGRRAPGLDVEVWDEARIRQERFGGLLGVAAGSDEPPAFVVLEYRSGGDAPDAGPGRQGRDVRLGRPLAQAERLDGGHEERHDRRGRRARHHAGRRAGWSCRSTSPATWP